ncbi:hypothetical protein BASA81_000815 [Batrachochytrium salamandrivorans]|nr:hypothetical protein BASA81_000815 [Batrachochytrium salamandrivorans]
MFLGPTTACLWEESSLLFGNGSTLYGENGMEIGDLCLPKGAVIHGIRSRGRLVFGGRFLAYRGNTGPYSEMFPEAVLDAFELPNNVIVVGFSSGKLVRINIQTREQTLVFKPAFPLQYLSMRFSNCRQHVCAGSVMGNLHVWEVDNPSRELETLLGHRGAVFCQRFHPSSRLLVTGGEDRTVRLWERRDKRFVLKWTGTGPSARVWDCEFWSGGVVCVGEDSFCRVFDWTGRIVKELDTGGRNLYCVQVRNDLLVCAGFSAKLFYFDLAFVVPLPAEVATPVVGKSKRKHDNLITALRGNAFVNERWEWNGITLRYDPGTKRGIIKCLLETGHDTLLVGTSLGRLLKFDLNGQLLQELDSALHNREISVLERYNTELLLTCSGDGQVCVREFSTGKVMHHTALQSSPTCALFLTHTRFVVGDSFGNVLVFSLGGEEMKLESSFTRAHGLMPVTCLQKLHEDDGNVGFVSAGRNGNVVQYSPIANSFTLAIVGVQCKLGGISQVELMHKELVVGTLGESLLVYDTKRELVVLETREFKRPFQVGKGCIEYAGDGGNLEVIQFDYVLFGRINATTTTSSSHFKMIWACQFLSPDEYITVSEDETLRLWQFPHRLVKRVETPQISIRSIKAFDTNSKLVVCGNGGLVQVYQRDLLLLAEHRPLDDGQVRMMCCDAVGSTIVCGGSDGYVFVYQLAPASTTTLLESSSSSTANKRRLPSGNKLKPTLTTHYTLLLVRKFGTGSRAILCCKLVGGQVYCGETDGSLKRWNVQTGELEVDLMVQCAGAGLNCLDVAEFEEQTIVWCGGDDQSLVRVVLSNNNSHQVDQYTDLAAAGITGIHLVSPIEAVFASADQRLARVRVTNNNNTVEFLQQEMVNVGDVAGLAVCGDRILVVGLGVEAIRA